MDTIIVKQSEIAKVVTALNQGDIVAFPTETVFGVAILFKDDKDIDKLVKLKQRPQTKPISVMVKDIAMLESLAILSEDERKVVNALMPGEITGVFKKREHVSDALTMGQETIGIRIPDHPFVLALLKELQLPLLVTSANDAGQETGITLEQVKAIFEGRIPIIVEGETNSQLASTVMKIEDKKVIILRQGSVTKEMIERVLE